jgi:hypothetical protein
MTPAYRGSSENTIFTVTIETVWATRTISHQGVLAPNLSLVEGGGRNGRLKLGGGEEKKEEEEEEGRGLGWLTRWASSERQTRGGGPSGPGCCTNLCKL